jgi:hypothetical protein
MGGKADVAAISCKGQLELADILSILETGQLLNFIEIRGCINYRKGYSANSPAGSIMNWAISGYLA